MSLNEYRRADTHGFCDVGEFPDDCPALAQVSINGAPGVCFRHALIHALTNEPEAQAIAAGLTVQS